MLLLNPRRRRRKSKARRRAGRRKMSALQLKYFGKRRHSSAAPRRRRRRHSSARRSRRSVVVLRANPSRRRRRGSSVRRAFSSVRRRFRRSGGGASVRASLGYVISTAKNALAGGAGAVVADVAYAQALNFAPASLAPKIASRYSESGGVNLAYYGAKLGLVTALGVLASRFAPGGMRGYVARGVEGAYTVSAYEIIRLMMPANVALAAYASRGRRGVGYNNPARVLPSGANSRGVGAYASRRLAGLGSSSGAGSLSRNLSYGDARIGEAPVQ